ncbi:putative hydrogenase nickel incorporation protein HypA [Dictyobacter alpinus]|uniref:Hydrogenase maturation factor HypA n=1 Tax=Dictyobacter alpinus TaxID=2014873 RepID=A0A402BGC1_9CHLR|nr:hydrogenase maturation nickel metallochaperone HypA [Dictyobacter alpinus]GCE30454.1 putative hydrogenase nickel incorporation protein HypA [Dictyobacter alpinus]
MHELSIADAIAGTVLEQAILHHASHVKSVHVRIGEANGVVSDALSFCFEAIASSEPLLIGAELKIEHIPHRARCRGCGNEFHVVQYILQCPSCACWEADVLSGTEFLIQDMEIDLPTSEEEGESAYAQSTHCTEYSGSQ